MLTLKQYIINADQKHTAIGHFNISNLEGLKAVFTVAQRLRVPIIIGTSEKERAYIGVKQCVALIRSLREEFNYPIFLNADHTYSFQKVKEAVDAGYDAVIFDGAKLSLGDNIRETKKSVEYAKSVNPNIVVEGELGYIGSSSKLLDSMPGDVNVQKAALTRSDEAAQFVKETGVDCLAPAVGNIHGMLKYSKNPEIDIDLVKEIREKTGVPLVLHGGSGIPDYSFKRAILVGISVIHINTELRVAFRNTLENSLVNNPNEIAPYSYMENPIYEMEKIVEDKLKVFTTAG
ncbi:MAG: class II fructose-bisphosphate aldolase [Candidatus Paceibacterota bacterium]|jgi:fructose-bisphosphate aldolase class II|nr:class II fructose-bisphosphate aldolase family protein [Candidatus Paceibacterota bacterium]